MILDIFLLLLALLLLVLSLVATICVFITIKYRVPPVPSGNLVTGTMIDAAKITKHQHIYDLGCGWGGILFEAAKRHPNNTYTGIEILPPAVLYNQLINKIKGTPIQFLNQNFFELDLRRADVIFAYLWPSIMNQIEVEIWPTLSPGTRLISHGFKFPNVAHTELYEVKKHKVYVYVR